MNSFFANLFEFGGSFQSQVSTDLFDLNIYANSGIIMIIFVSIMAIFFYFLLFRGQAKWDTLKHWILWLLITTISNTIIVGMYTEGALRRNSIRAPLPDYIDFLFAILIWSILLFFLLSISFKSLGHSSRSRLPF